MEHCCKRLGVLCESPSTWAFIWAGLVPPVAQMLLGWIQGSGGSSWLEKAGHPDKRTFALGSDSAGEGCKGQEAGAPGAGENIGFRTLLHPACRPRDLAIL